MYVWFVVVPVLAKALRLVEEKARITVFDYQFVINLTLPFSWKLFYFSALMFVIGNILVAVFAPRIVKDHSDYGHFENAGKGQRQLSEYANRYVTSNESFEALAQSEGIDFDIDDKKMESFWLVYDWANNDLRWIRVFVSGLYLLAFSLFGVVVLENLVWVVEVAMRST